ncbi:hypothetical protein WDU94_011218, partial [Cyamophila willieti]
ILQRKKERGRIPLDSISVVEKATISLDGSGDTQQESNIETNNLLNGVGFGTQQTPAGFSIQIWYTTPGGQDVILYLITPVELERQDWLHALRNAVSDNSCLATHYHRGLWNGKRWLCCKSSAKLSQGCEACSTPLAAAGSRSNSLNASFSSIRSLHVGGLNQGQLGAAVGSILSTTVATGQISSPATAVITAIRKCWLFFLSFSKITRSFMP